jgi:importin subunit beta-1
LIPELMNRLNQTFQSQNLSGEAKERQSEVQALLCGSLQVIISKLDDSVILPHADSLMTLFLRVLDSKSSSVMEEALMAVGAIANRTGRQFEKYVSHLRPYLLLGLSNALEYKVCTVAVGLVGDISRALETSFAQLGDDVMKILLEHLQNTQIDRSVKPHIISAIGDIALAIAGYFERYLSYVMRMLIGASQTVIDEKDIDYESVEYIQQLRESILEAYTGIIHGLAQDNKQQLFLQSVGNNSAEAIFAIFDLLSRESEHSGIAMNESLLRAAVGLVGDIANRLPQSAQALRRPSVQKLLQMALLPQNEASTQETAQYASEQLQGGAR